MSYRKWSYGHFTLVLFQVNLPCNFQTGLGGRWFLGDSIFQDAFAYSWFLIDGRLLAGGRHLADSKEAATWELLLGLKKLTEADKSDTMLDHACVWARACVALLIARNSQ